MRLKGKNICLRLIEESDSAFVLGLRLDSRYNTFLSKVAADLEAQKLWIKNYKTDETMGTQFYFIIERNDGVPCGTVRIYDLRDDSFCWGSWILNDDKPRLAAIESAFLVYEFGFDTLGYAKSHFDVMKKNIAVIKFHTRMGAKKISEDENNEYFEIDSKDVAASKYEILGRIL